ncbi:hypothetical protein BGZ83_005136, partial [Gryganskiella cystojenkinii]
LRSEITTHNPRSRLWAKYAEPVQYLHVYRTAESNLRAYTVYPSWNVAASPEFDLFFKSCGTRVEEFYDRR